jgi:glycine/D-amino acid oxidase-like deaminating enzyme
MAQQPWLPATWDRQADVVVIGLGAAGAATAITVYDAGAKVILLDKAPQGHEGGNTRANVCVPLSSEGHSRARVNEVKPMTVRRPG